MHLDNVSVLPQIIYTICTLQEEITMSKFSEYLRNLINGSGESISAISRSIGAERTSIHKALSDERVLPCKVVQNLARHFNLSLDER